MKHKPLHTILLIAGFLLLAELIVGLCGVFVERWLVLLGFMGLFCGLQLAALGVVGSYVGKTYGEVKARPRYFLEENTLERSR